MKITKRIVCFSALAAGLASAASSHNVTLSTTVLANGTQLPAGNYTVEMQGDKAIFKRNKETREVAATLQTGDRKYEFTTAVVTSDSTLTEIDLGGTKNRITFNPAAPGSIKPWL